MKEITVKVIELTKEEAKKIPKEEQILIYNPIMDYFRLEYGTKNNLAHNKYTIPELKYFYLKEMSKLKGE